MRPSATARREERNVSFDPPRGWTEASVAVFRAHVGFDARPVPSIHVAWEPLRGASVEAHALTRLAAFGEDSARVDHLAKFVVGRPAVGFRIKRDVHPAVIEASVVVAEMGDAGDAGEAGDATERAVLVLTLVTSSELAAGARATFERMLRTVRFDPHGDGAPNWRAMTYQHRNVSFEPPAEWVEATVAAYHGSPEPDGARSTWLTVGREPLAPGVSLRAHADRAVVRMVQSGQVTAFQTSESLEVGGRDAILVRTTMPSPSGEMERTLVLIAPGDEEPAKVMHVVSTAPLARADEARHALAEMLASLRFADTPERRPSTSTSRAPPPLAVPPLVPIPGTRRGSP